MTEKGAPVGAFFRSVPTEDNLVRPDQTKDIARLAVQKIKVQIIVRQAPCFVFQRNNFLGQAIPLGLQRYHFGFDLHAPEQAEVALNAGEHEIDAQ